MRQGAHCRWLGGTLLHLWYTCCARRCTDERCYLRDGAASELGSLSVAAQEQWRLDARNPLQVFAKVACCCATLYTKCMHRFPDKLSVDSDILPQRVHTAASSCTAHF